MNKFVILVALVAALAVGVATANKLAHKPHHLHQQQQHQHQEQEHSEHGSGHDQDLELGLHAHQGHHGHESHSAGHFDRDQFDREDDRLDHHNHHNHHNRRHGQRHGQEHDEERLEHQQQNRRHNQRHGLENDEDRFEQQQQQQQNRRHNNFENEDENEEGHRHHGFRKPQHKVFRNHGHKHQINKRNGRPQHGVIGAFREHEGQQAGFEKNTRLADRKSISAKKGIVAGEKRGAEADFNRHSGNEDAAIHKHQQLNRNKVIIKDQTTGVNDVDGFRHSRDDSESAHLAGGESKFVGAGVSGKAQHDREFEHDLKAGARADESVEGAIAAN